MKIIILMGSPNRTESTGILVEEFTRGAEEAGHSVELIDVCHANIHPCTGCVRCGYEGPCVQKDDVEMIRRKLLSSDMVVFATPLYYYGMTVRHDRPAEDRGGPLLRLQQQPEQQTPEIGPADGRLECG